MSIIHFFLQQRGEAEDEPVDVEGDDETYEEYTWAGQTRIRTTSMLEGGFASKYTIVFLFFFWIKTL